MWQKAKIIRGYYQGKYVWLETGEPQHFDKARQHGTGLLVKAGLCYSAAVVPDPPARGVVIRAYSVELLPEFAEDRPIQTWDELELDSGPQSVYVGGERK